MRRGGLIGFLRHHFINLLGSSVILGLAYLHANDAAYLALGGVLGIANWHKGVNENQIQSKGE